MSDNDEANDPDGSGKSVETTRRNLIVQIAFLSVPSMLGSLFSSTLKINRAVEVAGGHDFYQPSKVTAVPNSNLSKLGRAFLFGESKTISGIPAKTNPFMAPGAIPASSHDALNSIIRQLHLDREIELTDIPPTDLPQGTALFTGGPVESVYTRIVLGSGRGSPLFRVLDPKYSGVLPVMFDLDNPVQSQLLPYSDGSGQRPDWGIIINGYRTNNPPEFLLITSIPNPYAPAHRLVFVAGRHGAGARAIELVLSDERILTALYEKSRHFVGWQALIAVPNVKNEMPIAPVGSIDVFEITADFDKLSRLLEGKPLFSHPYIEAFAGTLGLGYLVDPLSSPTSGDLLRSGQAEPGRSPGRPRARELPSEVQTETIFRAVENVSRQVWSSEMHAYAESLSQDKDAANAFLRRAGIIDASGNLMSRYT